MLFFIPNNVEININDVYFNTMMCERYFEILHKEEYIILSPVDAKPWVQRVAAEEWGSHFYHDLSYTDTSIVAFVQNGNINIKQRDKEVVNVSPGSILYLAPYCDHVIETVRGEGARLLVIQLRGKVAVDLVMHHLPLTSTKLDLANSSRVESLFYRIFEAGQRGGFHTTAIVSGLLEPLLLTINQEYSARDEAADHVFALFNRCRAYIDNNWRTIGSVKDIPALFGIGQPYMGRLFKRYEDCTPHQFLLKRKMSYALYQLQQGECSVSNIAEELGFADVYSFSKSFKRIMGKSPTEMR